MTPKEIGRLAGRIFGAVVPANWAVRSQEDQEDYGVDYEIELTTPDDRPTGFIFKIQQKGQLSLPRNVAGDTISFSDLPIEKLGYYLHDLKLPILLVVVDVTEQDVFWVQLQGNDHAQAAYDAARAHGRKTVTVHIPVANRLPETAHKLLDSARKAGDWLLVQGIRDTTPDELTAAAVRARQLDSVAEDVRKHLDSLRCEQIEVLIRDGSREQALEMASRLLEGDTETTAMRVAAGMNVIRIYGGMLAMANAPDRYQELVQVRAQTSTRVLEIVRATKSPAHLRVYARFMIRSARLRSASEQAFGLWMSLKAQESMGDHFTRYVTQAQLRPVVLRLLRELRATYRLIEVAARGGHFHLIPQMWAGTIHDGLPYLLLLRETSSPEAAASLVEWWDAGGVLALELAAETENWRDLGLCAITFVQLAPPADQAAQDQRFETAQDWIRRITDETLRDEILGDLEEQRTLFQPPSGGPTVDQEIAMYRQMAAAMGVNLDDPNDDIARIVNIGLQDLNPERVLRQCEHLFVSLGSHGIPAQMLGLPTAGSKNIHCMRHGHIIQGLSLDSTFDTFKQFYCNACGDCTPRPADWQWTREWQQEQDRAHAEEQKRGGNGDPN